MGIYISTTAVQNTFRPLSSLILLLISACQYAVQHVRILTQLLCFATLFLSLSLSISPQAALLGGRLEEMLDVCTVCNVFKLEHLPLKSKYCRCC